MVDKAGYPHVDIALYEEKDDTRLPLVFSRDCSFLTIMESNDAPPLIVAKLLHSLTAHGHVWWSRPGQPWMKLTMHTGV